MRVPVTTLNDGYDFPLLGLGTYKLQGDDVETIVARSPLGRIQRLSEDPVALARAMGLRS